MGPCLAVEGGATKAVFGAYIELVLAPSLSPGQTVVMDNLSAHKGVRVRELVEGRGCEVLFLPSYSPDFSPIEEAFSKLKGCWVRRRHARRRHSSRRSGERLTRSHPRTHEAGSAIAAMRYEVNYPENRCR